MTTDAINIFWLRNDLRTEDNKGLYYSLTTGACKTLLLFIFDPFILDKLASKEDMRVTFIAGALKNLEQSAGCSILCSFGKPAEVFGFLAANYNIAGVYSNEDYEPYSIDRDNSVEGVLALNGIKLHRFKDSVVFAKNDILKGDNTPYTVYTPYANAWKRRVLEESEHNIASFNSGALLKNLVDPGNMIHFQDTGSVKLFAGVPELSSIG
jgi:deoxyribodipyrimidine photo-lyase